MKSPEIQIKSWWVLLTFSCGFLFHITSHFFPYDKEYAYVAENMKDLCFRRVKDSLLENALKKIESGDTAVLNKMLGIYFKNLHLEIRRARTLNDVEIVTKTKYIRAEEMRKEDGNGE